jgi:hypothetical protein
MLLAVALFTGCQATPNENVVARKDLQQMLEQAQKESAEINSGISLSEQYGIPNHYTYEATGAGGMLNINVDAAVNVPTGSAMPIYRVKATEFSQEVVTAFFQALCGDAEMYIDSGQRTKEQIRQDILSIESQIAQIKDDPQRSEETEAAKSALAEQEREWETAPDTLMEDRTDGTLLNDKTTASDVAVSQSDELIATPMPQAGGSGTGLEAYERVNGGDGRRFGVSNDSTPAMLYYDCRNSSEGSIFGQTLTIPIQEESDIDTDTLSKVGIKPKEASQLVQSLLNNTDSGMVVDRMYLQNDAIYYDDGIAEPAKHYAYLIYCVRTVDGLPCSYVAGASYQADDAVAPYWQYEEMYFLVNGEGIFEMWWTCPIEVVEMINNDARLKSFQEIQGIFEKMMLVRYEALAEYNKYDFEINRATLALHRIVEQNSNGSGLLVPAWNYYGKLITDPDDPLLCNETLDRSFLTINAIDGSLIDVGKGY